MKLRIRLVFVLAVGLTIGCLGGCKKSGGSGSKPTTIQEGLTQMQASLMTASPAAQSNFFNHVQTGFRYDNFPEALSGLEAIAADPSLNEQQKKLTSDVTDLVKAKMQGQPAAAK